MRPMYQNSTDTVPYVDTANTSHSSGERKFCQMTFEFGIGKRYHAYHTRPTWKTGKIAMASAARLIDVRHFWRSRHKMAEMSVPAWPIPIQKTKLTMSHAQLTGFAWPHTPTPVATR